MSPRCISLLAFSLMVILPCAFVQADEKDGAGVEKKVESLREKVSETTHTAKIQDKEISYKATTGNILLKDEKGNTKANIFYIAYTKQDEADLMKRPLTFLFNGGPGAASVWMHLGAFGPMRLALDDDGIPLFPYHVVNNDYSILDLTDLVFVDPVSTGYSRANSEEEAKQYHGYEEDIKSVGEFVRLYVTRNNRWSSPKFLAGESYGTTRAAGLSLHLHDSYNMVVNGLILLSSALDFQAFDLKGVSDLAYINYLPSFTAAAWYYKQLPESLQSKSLEQALKEAKDFAYRDYAVALLQGDNISAEDYQAMVQKVAFFTALPPAVVELCNLRVPMGRFVKELMRDKGIVIGRFDARFKGYDYDREGEICFYDPTLEILAPAFTSAVNEYLRNDLKWESDEEYKILTNVYPWNFGKATNQYLNLSDTVREVMTKNPHLQIFAAAGYYDLAIPFSASQYMFSHLNLDPALRNHVQQQFYYAGHMMFVHKPSLIKLRQDVESFIRSTE